MNRKSIKGFTLVELLAVLVVLAALMAIGIPIVERVINKAKVQNELSSAKNYLRAVQVALNVSELEDKIIVNETYDIMKDGNICIGALLAQRCDGEKLEIKVNGKLPTSGKVTVENGKITNLKLVYDDKIIMKDSKGELAFYEPKYNLGDEIKFDPGDGEKIWYVVGEDIDTVTLLLDHNLGNPIEWISLEDYCVGDTNCNDLDTDKGPITALNYLNTLTTNWTNVEPLKFYEYINNRDGTEEELGYQKLSIVNGVSTITHKDGTNTKIIGETKATLYSDIDENISEEWYRAYIQKNLSEIKIVFEEGLRSKGIEVELKATTVDELIAELDGLGMFDDFSVILTLNDHYVIVLIVELSTMNYGIDEEYTSQKWLRTNLEESEGFWTVKTSSNSVYFNTSNGIALMGSGFISTNTKKIGIRPIIIIPKSKLN